MVGPISRIYNTYIKPKPAVTKPASVSNGGVEVGDGNESREKSDFTEQKKAEASTQAVTYGSKGQVYNAEGQEIEPE
ncbi:MAG: hypothetical protein ACRBDI_07090 [Alphaproteobacteria bacterium]